MQPQTCSGCVKCLKGFIGAGVLLINSEKKNNEEIMLINFNCDDQYGVFGGVFSNNPTELFDIVSSDNDKALFDLAKNNIYEKSRGTISIKKQDLKESKYIDIVYKDKIHKHRCYLVRKKKISCANFAMINPDFLPQSMKETKNMKIFPINSLKKDYETNNWKLNDRQQDSSGQFCQINLKCKKILQKAFLKHYI